MITHDLHVHTPLSGCGLIPIKVLFESLKHFENEGLAEISSGLLIKEVTKRVVLEYFKVATERGVHVIGFTDHAHYGSNFWIFPLLRDVLNEIGEQKKIRVFIGSEADVLNEKGEIALPEKFAKQLNYVLAGLHHYHLEWVKKPKMESIEDVLDYALIEIENTLKNPLVSALAHPWLPVVSFIRKTLNPNFSMKDIPDEYFYKTCELAERYNKPIQVLFFPKWDDPNHALYGIRKFLKIIAESDCMIFYGSDTHRPDYLAITYDLTFEILGEINEERVWLPMKEEG